MDGCPHWWITKFTTFVIHSAPPPVAKYRDESMSGFGGTCQISIILVGRPRDLVRLGTLGLWQEHRTTPKHGSTLEDIP